MFISSFNYSYFDLSIYVYEGVRLNAYMAAKKKNKEGQSIVFWRCWHKVADYGSSVAIFLLLGEVSLPIRCCSCREYRLADHVARVDT